MARERRNESRGNGLRVLVATDFSEASCRARDYAIALAAPGATLSVLHVTALPIPGRPEPVYVPDWLPREPSLREELAERLHQFAAPASAAGLRVETLTEEGVPADVILKQAAALRPDLIATGTHGRRGFEDWMIGSTAERVVRLAPVPVLTASSRVPRTVHGIRRVLCPLGPEAGPDTLALAAELARRCGSALTVMQVVDRVGCGTRDGWRQEVEARLKERIAELKDNVPAEVLVQIGRPSRRIVDMVQEHRVDLVVMGIHDGWWWSSDRGFLGSTADRVIRAAPCAVITVRRAPGAQATEEHESDTATVDSRI